MDPSDESERQRINQAYIDAGLGEPIHIEETNDLITEEELNKAADELMGLK